MDPSELNDDQRQYLQGFISGAQFARSGQGLSTFEQTLGMTSKVAAPPARGEDETSSPEALHWTAQRRVIDEGKTLTPQEKAKRARHPLDMWDDVVGHAAE